MSPEPWLRGPLRDVHPLVMPTLHAYQQTREDLARWTEGLTEAQIWDCPHGLPSLGFHLRHIAGSVDRLTTYLEGCALSEEQLQALRVESEPGATRDELLSAIEAALARSADVIRAVPIEGLTEPRTVGRQALPSTAHGLIVHLAEHTMRHVGQSITTARLLRALA